MDMLHGVVEVTRGTATVRTALEAGEHAQVIVPPDSRDSTVRPTPEPDQDGEAAERRAEIADLTRRVIVGAALTVPVLFGGMAWDFFHPAW